MYVRTYVYMCAYMYAYMCTCCVPTSVFQEKKIQEGVWLLEMGVGEQPAAIL